MSLEAFVEDDLPGADHPAARVAGLVLVDAAGFDFKPESLPLGFAIARIPVLREPMRWLLPRRAIENSVLDVYGDPGRVTAALVERYYELTLREGNRVALMRRMDQLAPGRRDHLVEGLRAVWPS